jgi:hypothetical protein
MGVKAKVTDNLFCGEFVLISHKFQNIDQFLCQRWLYRPFIDHFSEMQPLQRHTLRESFPWEKGTKYL